MNLFQGHPGETYTKDLNQTKSSEAGDLIWLCPTRVAKKEMDLSGIVKDNWTLVMLTILLLHFTGNSDFTHLKSY